MDFFEPICLEHRALFAEAHAAEPTRSSGDSFGCVYLWDLLCRRNIARLGGRLGIEYQCGRGTFYAYPAGSGSLTDAVEALRGHAEARGRPLEFRGLSPQQKQALEDAFPDRFDFSDDRNNYDYIHDIESVATLAGKKLHGKRNFCNRFEKTHDWAFHPIGPEHFGDCLSILDEWRRDNDGGDREEALAIEKAFHEWDRLGLTGGVLYADARPVAFTIGEQIAPDTVDIHFEKAAAGVPGAYPMVAREYARLVRDILPEVKFLNREEDMGRENLRRAKQEWYPLYLLEKSTARWREGA